MWRYNSGVCICDTIPRDADAAVQVNVRSLEKYFVHDLITNPFAARKGSEASAPSQQKSASSQPTKVNLMDCLTIPKSVTFYRRAGKKAWLSSALKLKDAARFRQFLEQNDFVADKDQSYRKAKQIVIIDDNNNVVRFAYALGRPSEVVGRNEKGFLKAGDALFDLIKNSSSDMTYADGSGQELYLNFGSGEISLEGRYHIPALEPDAKTVLSEGLGMFSAHLDLAKVSELIGEKRKKKFEHFVKLDLDSIAQYSGGEVSAVFYDMKLVEETITSYEYDDDFNKVEVKKTKTNLSPDFAINMAMNEEGYEYLRNQKAVVMEQGTDILAIMPLVKTYSEHSKNVLELFTSQEQFPATNPSDLKMKLFMNIEQFLDASDGAVPTWAKNLKDFSQLDFEITNDDKIEGRLVLQEEGNAFVSLIN